MMTATGGVGTSPTRPPRGSTAFSGVPTIAAFSTAGMLVPRGSAITWPSGRRMVVPGGIAPSWSVTLIGISSGAPGAKVSPPTEMGAVVSTVRLLARGFTVGCGVAVAAAVGEDVAVGVLLAVGVAVGIGVAASAVGGVVGTASAVTVAATTVPTTSRAVTVASTACCTMPLLSAGAGDGVVVGRAGGGAVVRCAGPAVPGAAGA